MTILIDAWLERRDPALRFWDCDKHEVLAEWSVSSLRNLLEQGLLELDDLAGSVGLLLRPSIQKKIYPVLVMIPINTYMQKH